MTDHVLQLDDGKLKVLEAKLTDNHGGRHSVESGETITVFSENISSFGKFEKQTGFIKHSGFIKGDR